MGVFCFGCFELGFFGVFFVRIMTRVPVTDVIVPVLHYFSKVEPRFLRLISFLEKYSEQVLDLYCACCFVTEEEQCLPSLSTVQSPVLCETRSGLP